MDQKSYSIKPTVLIIVGVTGDLSKRKLLPAVEQILKVVKPGAIKVLGVTRQSVSAESILKDTDAGELLAPHFSTYQMNLTDIDDYCRLEQHLLTLDVAEGEPLQKLFYLSIPPQISSPVVEQLGESGIAKLPGAKLLLEKPFGVDLESASELVENAKAYFAEDQIYRIDHYLAKEMTQNLIVFRENNSLFRRTWNAHFIESIEVIATEEIGIEGRADFYEQTGALRDLVQSHLLQLTALVLADLKSSKEQGVPKARLEALQNIMTPQDIARQVTRAQYVGYREEVNNPVSTVETYVSLTLFSKDSRWAGVPITIKTGKALGRKATEIRLTYRQESADEANVLVLHIQPNEGVELELWAKEPGYGKVLKKVPLNFNYDNHFTSLPEAYERVFMDAIRSDHSLFTTSAEVLETWRILDPVQKHWAMDDTIALYVPGKMPEGVY